MRTNHEEQFPSNYYLDTVEHPGINEIGIGHGSKKYGPYRAICQRLGDASVSRDGLDDRPGVFLEPEHPDKLPAERSYSTNAIPDKK